MRYVLGMLAVLLALSSPAAAADAAVAGVWAVTITTPMGDFATTLTLAVDGKKVTGTDKNDMGEQTVDDGKVEGNVVTFKETSSFGEFTYTCKVDGDTMAIEIASGFGPMQATAKRSK